MPIQIIDNFDLTTAKPIDNRIVVGPTPSFYQNKDSIPNKYQGMRIWELPGSNLTSGGTNSTADGLAYVWTGSAWISENTTSISGSGTVGIVAYFSAANTIQSSNIYFANDNIGIGANAESASGAKLFVSGSIKTSVNFVGPGSGITSINASNISSGTLNALRFGGDANSGWILTSNNVNSASYKNPSTINVGSATTLQTSRSIWGKSFNGSSDITGDISLGGHIYRSKSIALLSGGVDSSGTFRATIQFNGSATANKTISIPTDVPNTSTFAFLERIQTFSAAQTMGSSLTVNGTTTINNQLTVSGGNRAFFGGNGTLYYSPNSSPQVIVGGNLEIQNGGLYNNLYYGSSNWRSSYNKPGYAFFYQEFNSENKYVFYVSSATSPGNVSTLKEAYRIDPNSSKPKLEVVNGVILGPGGTPISKIIVGRISVNVDGAGLTPVIKAGTGFTAAHVPGGSGVDLEIKITLSSVFPGISTGTNPDNVVVLCQAVSGVASAYFYCNTWTNTSFNLRGIGFGSGSVQIHFTAYSVS